MSAHDDRCLKMLAQTSDVVLRELKPAQIKAMLATFSAPPQDSLDPDSLESQEAATQDVAIHHSAAEGWASLDQETQDRLKEHLPLNPDALMTLDLFTSPK